jgi:hypothetical protein
MMIEQVPANPYSFTGVDLVRAPFAGREAVFARMRQFFARPLRGTALTLLGRRNIGKTACLFCFDEVFKDQNHVGVYVPLRETVISMERDWLLSLAQNITGVLVERSFTLSRISEMQPPGDDIRAWFKQTFMPPILTLIRPHRRLTLLLDDVEEIAKAIALGKLPSDTPVFLYDLVQAHPQLEIIMTLDTAHESAISTLQPLASLNDVARLNRLTLDETTWLLRAPVEGAYNVSDAAIEAVQLASGGEPLFVQRFGYRLFHQYEADPQLSIVTPEDIRRFNAIVYSESRLELGEMWEKLRPSERVVLKAISEMAYENPTHALDANAIGAWLANTETPLDETTINAAVRSLEYQELVRLGGAKHIMIAAGLMQTWLLENARNALILTKAAALPPQSSGADSTLARRQRGSRLIMLIVLLVMFAIGAFLLVSLSNAPLAENVLPPAEPTLTLIGG